MEEKSVGRSFLILSLAGVLVKVLSAVYIPLLTLIIGSAGMVYIAGSLKGSIIKIGYTKDVQIREESLNRTEYAGYYDWIVLLLLEV